MAFFGSVRILIRAGSSSSLQGRHHRQAADELRNQAELDQVFRLDFGQHLAHFLLALAALHLGAEADAADVGGTGLDHLVQPGERAAADEQDVLGVHLQEFLLRMLAPALRRNACHGAFDQLQQGLLHAFAGHIAGDRRVLALARILSISSM